MKYIVILIVVVVIVRIDFFMGVFDRSIEKFGNQESSIDVSELKSGKEIVPLIEDSSFNQSPKKVFLALLSDFSSGPSLEIRTRAISEFKEHPTMFTLALDQDLERVIFNWRDLLQQNNPMVGPFLNDLWKILQGENLLMLKKFYSLWMEIDMEAFLASYVKTTDTICSIATIFGDRIPEEEKINELIERDAVLKPILAKEKLDPAVRQLATNCQMVLGLEISKLAPESQSPPPAVEEALQGNP